MVSATGRTVLPFSEIMVVVVDGKNEREPSIWKRVQSKQTLEQCFGLSYRTLIDLVPRENQYWLNGL